MIPPASGNDPRQKFVICVRKIRVLSI